MPDGISIGGVILGVEDIGDGTKRLVVSAGAGTVSAKDSGPVWTAAHFRVSSADATGGVAICAAPTAGQKRAMTDLVLASGSTAVELRVIEAGTVAGTAGNIVHGPFYMPVNGMIQITTRSNPLSKLGTANNVYTLIASVAGSVTAETWTYSEA